MNGVEAGIPYNEDATYLKIYPEKTVDNANKMTEMEQKVKALEKELELSLQQTEQALQDSQQCSNWNTPARRRWTKWARWSSL